MQYFSKAIGLCALPALVACSSSSGPIQYEIVTTDGGTLEEQITSTGITGFGGNYSGDIQQFRVRLEGTYEAPVLFLSIGGGSEVELNFLELDDDQDFPIIVSNRDDEFDEDYDELFVTLNKSGDSLFITFEREGSPDFFEGTIGLRTATLPNDTVFYAGEFGASSLFADPTITPYAFASGEHTFAVNFSSGSVDGFAEGEVDFITTEGSVFPSFIADIDGDVVDGEFNATLTITDSEDDLVSGALDMRGAVYGETGSDISGGVGGSLTIDATDVDVGGWFVSEETSPL